MEILEKQDPEKKRLMDEAKKHKDKLTGEVRLVSERTEQLMTNAIVIGGALALTYLLVRQFSGRKSIKKKSKTVKLVTQPTESTASAEPEEESHGNSILEQIGAKIANEASVFLLNLAKEKLSEYLQSGKPQPSHENN